MLRIGIIDSSLKPRSRIEAGGRVPGDIPDDVSMTRRVNRYEQADRMISAIQYNRQNRQHPAV